MQSLWIDTFKKTYKFPKFSGASQYDVCIVGGGIFGISCAYYLTKLGFQVTVLEKDEIASKTTGHTTAKITSQHGLLYHYLIEQFARAYLEANEKAIEAIKEIIDTEHISCDFSYQNSFIYTTKPEELQNIHDEVSAVQSLNFTCEFTTKVGLPFEVLGSCV